MRLAILASKATVRFIGFRVHFIVRRIGTLHILQQKPIILMPRRIEKTKLVVTTVLLFFVFSPKKSLLQKPNYRATQVGKEFVKLLLY